MPTTPPLEQLKFPIGNFKLPSTIDEKTINSWIESIELFPSRLEALVGNLSSEELEWPYRPEGWNIRQVIHHCADSHFNAFTRFKLALTEDMPTIKPYEEAKWALLPDMDCPIEDSLWIIKGLHARWTRLLRSLSASDRQKMFVHPEHGKTFSLETTMAIYDWHSNHHLAHVKQAIQYQGKFE